MLSKVTLLSRASRAMRARVLVRASIALLIAGVACGGDATAPVCSGPVNVQVSGSLPPVISWTPDCSVEHLVAGGSVTTGFVLYWAIAAGERRIESGVRFGQVPRGAVEESSAFLPSGVAVNILLESPRGTTVGTATWVAP
jgi:hypothetical protein